MAMPITKFYTGRAPDPGTTQAQSAAYMFPHAPQGSPMPSGAPMPSGGPMPGGTPMQVPPAYGGAPAPSAAPPAMAPQAPAQAPVAAYVSPPPMGGGIGKNGFGLHPDTTMDHITDYLMGALRNHESVNNYKADYPVDKTGKPLSTATGAYQVTRGTWNNFRGFPEAKMAPPEIQDEWAKQNVGASVKKFGGDLFKAAANHYYPAWAHDPTRWNEAPVKGAPTITQYLNKVLPPDKVSQYLAGAGPNQGGGAGG